MCYRDRNLPLSQPVERGMTMNFGKSLVGVAFGIATVSLLGLVGHGQEGLRRSVHPAPQEAPQSPAKTPSAAQTRGSQQALLAGPSQPEIAAAAKADFDKAFTDYKATIRKIEQLRIDYQTADSATRVRINNELSGHVVHAQSLMNAMVETAVEVHRLAPKSHPQITDLLVAVAKHYSVGEQIGRPERREGVPGEHVPISGGDQYERALPIIKRLVDGGVENRELFIWGFLSAFCLNDYDLAEEYFKTAQENGALKALSDTAKNQSGTQQAAAEMTYQFVMQYSAALGKYRELWAKEAALRAAEANADDLPRVRLTSTKGVITIELFENEAPQSVANFITLVKDGFYTDTPFHRVLPLFMAQGGAKTDDGDGGPGYTIRGEHDLPNARNHFRGTLSMARIAGRPNSGSSQFFLTFVPTTHLDKEHAVFGRVIEGIEVLGDLERRSPMHQANPPKPDRILKAEVIRDRGHEYKFEKLQG
jgi:cyclophilin family peptidyl-prolyl cis-trans isomerase